MVALPLSAGRITMFLFFLRLMMALLSYGERLGLGGFVSSMWYFISSRKACASLSSLILLARSSVLAMRSILGATLGVEARFSPNSRTSCSCCVSWTLLRLTTSLSLFREV